jgi:hypothetical protein
MKKIATILIALIATASVSFAAGGNDYQVTPSPQSMQLEEFLDNYATTYQIQAVSQEVVAPANVDFQVPGLYSTYSIDNTLIDTTAFNRSTNLEGFLAQVDQARHIEATTASAKVAVAAPHI